MRDDGQCKERERERWQSRSVGPPERSCGASISLVWDPVGSARTLHGVAYCVCASGVCLSATKVPILGHISPISHLKAQAERRGGPESGGRWVSGNDFHGSCCSPGSSGSSQNALQQHGWWDRRQECWSSTRAYTHLLYSATQTHTVPSSTVGLIMGSWRKSTFYRFLLL